MSNQWITDTVDMMNEITRLRAALSGWDELRMTIADLDGQSESWPDHGNAPLAIAASYALLQMSNQDLHTALAEAERDAARYRWIRDGSAKDISDIEPWLYETRDELDAAIDAAMAREEG